MKVSIGLSTFLFEVRPLHRPTTLDSTLCRVRNQVNDLSLRFLGQSGRSIGVKPDSLKDFKWALDRRTSIFAPLDSINIR